MWGKIRKGGRAAGGIDGNKNLLEVYDAILIFWGIFSARPPWRDKNKWQKSVSYTYHTRSIFGEA